MVSSLFDLNFTLARRLFDGVTWPWEVLDRLTTFVLETGPGLGSDYEQIAQGIWVGKGTRIDPLAALRGPAILGHDNEVRPGAFVRAGVVVGDGCVVGNSSELKNCLLFDGCQVPHFSYVGDSILGRNVHFGGGAIASNYKSGGAEVRVWWDGQRVATGRTKLGVLAGDGADVGAQAVLNPGTILGRGTVVYPLVSVRGTVPPETIVKTADPAGWVAKN